MGIGIIYNKERKECKERGESKEGRHTWGHDDAVS